MRKRLLVLLKFEVSWISQILLLGREEKENVEGPRVTFQKSWGNYTDQERQEERSW